MELYKNQKSMRKIQKPSYTFVHMDYGIINNQQGEYSEKYEFTNFIGMGMVWQ
jgi:hypothetical protein